MTIAAAANAHHRPGGVELRNDCHRLYPQERFYRYTEQRYRVRTSLTKRQKGYILRMARCQNTKKAQEWALRKRRLYIRRRAARLAYYRVTPYDCGSAGRFAIPCYVVACESHYSWSAYNASSGARGPYQFVGWRVPWPVRTFADRLAHHRMARYLWNDSPSHWVCA